ncbi:MAG: VRR-NUC domain-containing protein [Acidiferrobacteraceae bacterium]
MMSRVPPAVRARRAVSESALQTAIIDLARRLGWLVAHHHDSRRQIRPGVHVGDRDAAGLPDLTLVRDGRLLFCELKGSRGRLRPAQQQWLDALALVAANAPETVGVHVWRPDSWDEIERVLMGGRA